MRGQLTGDPGADQPVLDDWAARHTDGMIPRMPVTVTPATELLLASALLVVTTWAQPFEEHRASPQSGPWQDRDLTGLHRRTRDLSGLGKRLVRVSFDRPFGFLAVHRRTGLVLVAGWVDDPDPYQRTGPAGY